jgi:hypothetical protein
MNSAIACDRGSAFVGPSDRCKCRRLRNISYLNAYALNRAFNKVLREIDLPFHQNDLPFPQSARSVSGDAKNVAMGPTA